MLCLALVIAQLVLAVAPPGADERADALRDAAVAIASTDPTHADFSDLEPLVGLIADARVVSLGEMTHGDGTAFLARTRLVRFLHERLGFDVIAFESGVIECERVMEALRGDGPVGDAIDLGIYPVWAESAEIRPLFEYVRATQATERPLRLVGFDPQFSSSRTAEYLREGLAGAVTDPMLSALGDVSRTVSDEQFTEWSRLLDEQQVPGVWRQAVESLRWQLLSRYKASKAPPLDFRDLDRSLLAPERIEAGNARDRGMADNLLWHLRERWPDAKAIVWAANNHVRTASARRSTGGEPVLERRMGQVLKQRLGDDLYTVVTTCREGAWAAASLRAADGTLKWQDGEHPPAEAGSLAALLHRTGLPAAWLDLESASATCPWLAEPCTLRADFHDDPPHRLGDFCDAILYLDVITPATPARDP